MRVLALDTTTRGGSAALVADDHVVAERSGDPARSHAEQLPAMLLELAAAEALALDAVDLFAVASGPGSFTGLRIGIATVQGLAMVTGRRVAPVSALEALAHIAARDLPAGALVGVWIDAFRGDVFSALYRIGDAAPFAPARLVEVDAPAVGEPRRVLDGWTSRHIEPLRLIGDGAVRYAAVCGSGATIVPPPPLAGPLGLIAIHRAAAGSTVDPAGVQPLYIRRPDAEVARDRDLAGPAAAAPPPKPA